MHSFVIVNPKARDGLLKDNWSIHGQEVMDAIGDQQSTRMAFTTEEDHGSKMVRAALKSGAKRIIVVGGDGTLSEAIQGFFERGKLIAPDAVLMVMPAGRGDDFFKTMANQRFYQSRSAWKYALDLIRSGHSKPIDIGRISWKGSPQLESHYFNNIVSFGWPGLIVQKVQAKEGYIAKSFAGKSAWAYTLQATSAFFQYKPIDLQIRVDDQPFYDGPVLAGFILNGRFNAGGICWNPDAQVDDGLFHLVVMEPRSFLTYVKDSIKGLFLTWNRVGRIHRISGRKIEVSMKTPGPKAHPLFEVDGELLEDKDTLGATLEILPGAIQLQWK